MKIKEPKTVSRLSYVVHKISQYSLIFYIATILALIVFQLDVFKDNVPKSYIINGVIVITVFAVGTNMVDRVMRRKGDSKPFLYCPECEDAKMRPTGRWICEKCGQEFGGPRTE